VYKLIILVAAEWQKHPAVKAEKRIIFLIWAQDNGFLTNGLVRVLGRQVSFVPIQPDPLALFPPIPTQAQSLKLEPN